MYKTRYKSRYEPAGFHSVFAFSRGGKYDRFPHLPLQRVRALTFNRLTISHTDQEKEKNTFPPASGEKNKGRKRFPVFLFLFELISE